MDDLKSLIGEHTLDRPAMTITSPFNADASGIAFFLDGTVYLVIENPDDGYRSHMGVIFSAKASAYELGISDYENINRQVVCRHIEKDKDYNCDILEVIDVKTGHLWLRVGTQNTDDYYPWFLTEWNAMPPEATR